MAFSSSILRPVASIELPGPRDFTLRGKSLDVRDAGTRFATLYFTPKFLRAFHDLGRETNGPVIIKAYELRLAHEPKDLFALTQQHSADPVHIGDGIEAIALHVRARAGSTRDPKGSDFPGGAAELLREDGVPNGFFSLGRDGTPRFIRVSRTTPTHWTLGVPDPPRTIVAGTYLLTAHALEPAPK